MHVNDSRRIERLLLPSVALAEKFQAHLVALSIVPPMAVITEANGYSMVIDDHCKAYRERRPEMRAVFEAAIANRGFTTEWRDDDAGTIPRHWTQRKRLELMRIKVPAAKTQQRGAWPISKTFSSAPT